MATTITDYMESEPTKCGSCCKMVRKVLSFLLSHIGLLSLVVGYVIVGAFIFEELERENELLVKRNITANRYLVTESLWSITTKMPVLSQENWTSDVSTELRKFEKFLIIALKERGWDGNESEETVTWTFAGGLFYSITVITTIGYGHIAPKTPFAKVATIFYAILGIPLTVLCWSNIGDAMANAFRFCYWRIFCYICTKKDKNRRKKRALSRQRGKEISKLRLFGQRNKHFHDFSSLSVRYSASGRGRSVRRSQRPSQRSADTISDSINSYSFTDPDRYCEDDWEGGKGLSRNRPSKRSLQRSMNQGVAEDPAKAVIDNTTPTTLTSPTTTTTNVTTLALPQSSTLQNATGTSNKSNEITASTSGNSLSPPEKEKKQSAAGRMVRGLGLKRGEQGSSQKSQKSNGSTGSTEKTSSNPPATPQTISPPTTLGPFPSTASSSPSSPTTSQPPITTSSKGGTPPILIPNRGSRPPPLLSTTGQTPSNQSYRLDRVPEDEWIEDYYDDCISDDDIEDYSTKPVPIWLSVCLVIAYILGGAFLFQDWEGWSLLDSSYFCFITLTTIGFGDLVPDQKNTDGEIRIALCSLYLLFGIAMICMSFNLVQEEVINSVKGIGKQLGILKDDDEDDDY